MAVPNRGGLAGQGAGGGGPKASVRGVGWGGAHRAGLVEGVDQGPWLQERAMAVPKKGEGWGLVGCSRVGLAVPQKRARAWGNPRFGSPGQGRVGLAGQGLGGVQGLRFRGGGRW